MNILISYHYLQEPFREFIRLTGEHSNRFMMDSGAFSAYTLGKEISLGKYIGCLRNLSPYLYKYIMLDVLGNKEATKKNLAVMRKHGTNPMPVWTVDGTKEDLQEMMDDPLADSMCVAGGVRGPKWAGPRIETARNLFPEAFIHCLAFTDNAFIRTSVDSIDSSTFGTASRFGAFATFIPGRGLSPQIRHKDIRKKDFSDAPVYLKQALIDAAVPSSFIETQSGAYSTLSVLFVSAWFEMALFAKAHGKRLFFACSGISNIQMLAVVAANKHGRRIDWPQLKKDIAMLKEMSLAELAEYQAAASEHVGLFW